MTIFYRILQAIVGLGAAVLFVFFVIGLGDGSIDTANILLWLIMLAIPAGGLIVSHLLWSQGQKVAAWVLLLLPAVPIFLYGLFVLMFIILQPDFR